MKEWFYKFISFFFKSSASNTRIILGITVGCLFGFSPTLITLHTILILLSLFFFRFQWRVMGLSFGASYFASALFLDPFIDSMGHFVLQSSGLSGVFTWLAQLPIIPLTRFHNSMVMGSLILTLLAFPLIYFSVKKWRTPHISH